MVADTEAPLTIRDIVLEVRDGISSLQKEMRDTRHQVRTDMRAIELRVIELESFRKESERRHAAGERIRERYVPLVDHLSSQEKIEDAVKTALSETEHRGWTRRERVLGLALVVFSGVGAIGTIVSIYIVLT